MRGNKIMGFLWIVIALCLAVILVVKLNKRNTNSENGFEGSVLSISTATAELYDTLTFATEEIDEIDINLDSESVIFEKTADSKITVELYGTEKTVPKVYTVKNVLKIEEAYKQPVRISVGLRKVIVKLPQGYEPATVDVDVASGSVTLNDCTIVNLDVKAASGSLKINQGKYMFVDTRVQSGSVHVEGAAIDTLEAVSTSGSVKVNGSFEKIELRSTSGSVLAELDKPLSGKSELNTTSGSVRLVVPEDSNFNVKYSVTSGSYKNEITGTSGKKGSDVVGNGGPEVELRAVSGSVKVCKK